MNVAKLHFGLRNFVFGNRHQVSVEDDEISVFSDFYAAFAGFYETASSNPNRDGTQGLLAGQGIFHLKTF